MIDELTQRYINKEADNKPDSSYLEDKLPGHLLSGGAGAGAGLLFNHYVLNNNSLKSRIVSGIVGAGVGIGGYEYLQGMNKEQEVKETAKGNRAIKTPRQGELVYVNDATFNKAVKDGLVNADGTIDPKTFNSRTSDYAFLYQDDLANSLGQSAAIAGGTVVAGGLGAGAAGYLANKVPNSYSTTKQIASVLGLQDKNGGIVSSWGGKLFNNGDPKAIVARLFWADGKVPAQASRQFNTFVEGLSREGLLKRGMSPTEVVKGLSLASTSNTFNHFMKGANTNKLPLMKLYGSFTPTLAKTGLGHRALKLKNKLGVSSSKIGGYLGAGYLGWQVISNLVSSYNNRLVAKKLSNDITSFD